MKLLVLLLSVTTVSFCVAAEKLPAGHPPVNMDKSKVQAAGTSAPLPQKGEVIDVISIPQYTYLQVKQDNASIWLAGPAVEVKKGDTVRFDSGLEMKDFHSNSLDRTFPSIFFVNRVVVGE